MQSRTVYDLVPLLELDWEGISVARARLLAASEDWYWNRLSGVRGPVCELACGYGRLLLRFARAGVPVHGCDGVPHRVSAARKLFAEESLSDCTFEVQSMPEVPERRDFHAVILALNAIGYVTEDSEKRRLLGNIARILKPGGRLLLDYARGSAFLRLLRYWPGLRGCVGPDGARLSSCLRWDSRTDSICEKFVWRGPKGERHEFADHFRFASVRQTLAMLQDSGFSVTELCGSFAGTPYRPWSTRIALVARLERDGDVPH